MSTASDRQLVLYVAAVFEPRDTMELRLIRNPQDVQSLWFPAERLADEAARLTADNADGYNVFIGVNPRMAVGHRGNDAVAVTRCLFSDFDKTTVADAIARVSAAGLPDPTLIIDSGHGCHTYWRLAEPLAPQWWLEWMKDLAALLNSDPGVCNAERIMRAPGFQNLKREPAVPCRVVECAATRVYDLADLPIPMRPGSDTPIPVFRFVRHADDVGNRVGRCRAYLSKCPPAISGQYGHTTTWHAANTCNRFGLTKAEALELMLWYSETKCLPPWSQKEIEHKISDAYSRNAGQHGSKLREESRTSELRHPRPNPIFAVRRQIAGAA